MHQFQTLIILIFFSALLVGIAQKMRISFSIALILGGLLIGFMPGLVPISIQPNLLFMIVLPPILYYAAFSISFREFKQNWKEIFSLALGLVVLTTLLVGFLFKWLFPQYPWALAFAFGAIVSPPDSVATTSIMKRFAISPRLLAVLEGESLINDASALLLYRLAVTALLAEMFSFTSAGVEFVKIVVGGVAVGFVLGFILQHLSRKLLEPIAGILFSFTIPYVTFIIADYLQVSGVLAVVVNGLIGSHILANHPSSFRRVLGYAFWDMLFIFMNCFVFILIGLQLRQLIEVMTFPQMMTQIAYALLITLALIAIRFIWVYSRSCYLYFRALAKRKTAKLCPQILREAAIVSWSAMRGIVSLIAALGLPYAFPSGEPIEGRDEVIFITFIVILITLLLPSTTLAFLIKFLKIGHQVNHSKVHQARKHLVKIAAEKITDLYTAKSINEKEFHFLTDYFSLQRYIFEISDSHMKKLSHLESARLKVFQAQRKELLEMWGKQEIDDRVFRQLEHELDVEETHLPRAELK